jgi:hypothetical protein
LVKAIMGVWAIFNEMTQAKKSESGAMTINTGSQPRKN